MTSPSKYSYSFYYPRQNITFSPQIHSSARSLENTTKVTGGAFVNYFGHDMKQSKIATPHSRRSNLSSRRGRKAMPTKGQKRDSLPDGEKHEDATFSFDRNNPTWTYSLEVAEQPIRARMCGSSIKHRRKMSPSPIVKMIVRDRNGKLIPVSKIDMTLFVLHASLYTADQKTSVDIVTLPQNNFIQRNTPPIQAGSLFGNQIASPHELEGTDGAVGIYFIYNDLSVRVEGKFKLEFTLMNLGRFTNLLPKRGSGENCINTSDDPSPIIASVFSEAFQVYQAKKFPGMIEPTALARCFATQGVPMPVRVHLPSRKFSDSTGAINNDDEDFILCE